MKNVEQPVSFDDVADAMADVERRRLLVSLARDDSPVVVDGGRADDFQRLATMNHVHLPKLADRGFIRWNETTNEVRRGPHFEAIGPLLELLDEHGDDLPPDWL